jgi:hypothetical protein
MFPTAMACRVEASIRTMVRPLSCSSYICCACTVSVMTSGKGPSSRIDAARMKGTSFFTHS